MKLTPLLKCRDIQAAVQFYTTIMDFKLTYPEEPLNDWAVDLIQGDAQLQLTFLDSGVQFGTVLNVWINDLDVRFARYIQRGLDTSHKADSPVHQGPIDQSWGRREFYVTDPDGNTLRFCQLAEGG